MLKFLIIFLMMIATVHADSIKDKEKKAHKAFCRQHFTLSDDDSKTYHWDRDYIYGIRHPDRVARYNKDLSALEVQANKVGCPVYTRHGHKAPHLGYKGRNQDFDIGGGF